VGALKIDCERQKNTDDHRRCLQGKAFHRNFVSLGHSGNYASRMAREICHSS
jgi:hypothetical protein